MQFESEGIRHIEIQKKSKHYKDFDVNNDERYDANGDIYLNSEKSHKTHLTNVDSEEVNLNSLLKAVIDISDRLQDQEEKLKKHEESEKRKIEKEKELYKRKYNKDIDEKQGYYRNIGKDVLESSNFRSRPKTAVLRYNKEDYDSDLESSQGSTKSSLSSVRCRTKASRPVSAHVPTDLNLSASRLSMSFSNDKVRGIDMENQRLLKEILRNKAKNVTEKNKGPLRVHSAAAINRNKKQQGIEQENLRLLNRLQSVKATSGLSRDKLLKQHMNNEKHLNRISKSARPVSAPVSRSSSSNKSNLKSTSSVRSFDNESLASSKLSVLSHSSHRSRTSLGSSLKVPKKVKVEEYWEPGW